jgi:DNA polymerase-4
MNDNLPHDDLPPAPINVSHFPSAIMHLDADAFFAACEQVMHPDLRGKPVATGKERGIVAAASYEAKAKGVERGMRVHEAMRICPQLTFLPSDHESYSLFSVRMFEILRRFSPEVEEYSIDEAFVDLTGLRRHFRCTYAEIARRAQETTGRELGLWVSVGISLTKMLAKIGSKAAKPHGLVAIPGRHIHHYLAALPAEKVWGIGSNTANYLGKLKIHSALDFARKDEEFINKRFSKPFREIWHELNGRPIYPLETQPKTQYKSVSKCKTFTPASACESFVYAQLSRNLENACIKARRYHLAAKRITIFLRTQEYQDSAIQMRLTRATAFPSEIMPHLHEGFCALWRERVLYRATAVVLSHLGPEQKQLGLFDDAVQLDKMARLHCAVDELDARYGKHTVLMGTSLPTKLQAQHDGERGAVPWRKTALFAGENERQRLGLLVLDVAV